MKIFDDILGAAAGFVERQKGFWDHNAWDGFVREMRDRGFQFSDEMLAYLGQMLDAMKKFYRAASIETVGIDPGKILDGVAEQTARFVAQTKGMWDHEKWEYFLSDMRKRGVNLSGESASYLGEMLESVKRIYSFAPAVAPVVSKTERAEKRPEIEVKKPEVKKPEAKKPEIEMKKPEAEVKKAEYAVKFAAPELKKPEPAALAKPAKRPGRPKKAASDKPAAPAGGAKRGRKKKA
jgi:hypothetical protein